MLSRSGRSPSPRAHPGAGAGRSCQRLHPLLLEDHHGAGHMKVRCHQVEYIRSRHVPHPPRFIAGIFGPHDRHQPVRRHADQSSEFIQNPPHCRSCSSAHTARTSTSVTGFASGASRFFQKTIASAHCSCVSCPCHPMDAGRCGPSYSLFHVILSAGSGRLMLRGITRSHRSSGGHTVTSTYPTSRQNDQFRAYSRLSFTLIG